VARNDLPPGDELDRLAGSLTPGRESSAPSPRRLAPIAALAAASSRRLARASAISNCCTTCLNTATPRREARARRRVLRQRRALAVPFLLHRAGVGSRSSSPRLLLALGRQGRSRRSGKRREGVSDGEIVDLAIQSPSSSARAASCACFDIAQNLRATIHPDRALSSSPLPERKLARPRERSGEPPCATARPNSVPLPP